MSERTHLREVLQLGAVTPSSRSFFRYQLRIHACGLLLKFCRGSCLSVPFAPLKLRGMHKTPFKVTWLYFSVCYESFHLSFQRAAALQRTSTKDAFVPVIEMDQNVIHSTYQSAINLKDTVKLSVTSCREKKAEGTVSTGRIVIFCLGFELK